MNLKRIIKESEEEDGFNWVREIDPNQHIEFRNAVIGKTYRVEFDEILLDALDACNQSTDIYFYAKKAKVSNIDYEIPYNQAYCGSENEEKVISLYLKFDLGFSDVDGDKFWVTDDMVTLYDIYENLKESEEERDPFDWIRDTEPPSPHVPEIGMEFKIKNDEETGGVIYTITDITDTHMIINWLDPSDGEYMENYKWPLKHYFGFVDKGEIEIVYGNLKKIIKESEEEDDWAWARGPIWVEKVSNGDRIRVHNKGKKDAYINWLGMYSDEYLAGEYGVDIEGVVSGVADDEFALEVVSMKSGFGHSIYFPFKKHMEYLSSVDGEYNDFNLAYEFIPKS